MKKVLMFAAALVLAATPAAAQQSPAAAQQSAVAGPVEAPLLFVSPDEIRQRVAASEAEREGGQIGSTSWWYTVLAVALGVVIAMLLLDN